MEGKLKFEDSNIAQLGSEFELKLREKRADSEPEWKKIRHAPGIQIWRIEKFNVVAWPEDQYGSFFKGDTYIVLYVKKKEKEEGLEYYAHMWVGKETTVDEAGTGAYKIVELDDYLKRVATLIYEPQDEETPLFMSHFKTITIMEGGIESGFKKVPVDQYKPRLLHVRGVGNSIHSSEVPLKLSSLNGEDVFILDAGLKIFLWRGKAANSYEKFHGATIAEKLKNERNAKPEIITMDQGDSNPDLMTYFAKDGDIKDKKNAVPGPRAKKMLELSDESGKLSIKEVTYAKTSLNSKDTFLIDRGDLIFIWVGSQASADEKKYGIVFGQKYLSSIGETFHVPMLTVNEGALQSEIDSCFK